MERFLVWGLIAVGVAVIAWEARARMAYGQTESKIIAALEAADAKETSDLTIDRLPTFLVGNPTRTDEEPSGYNNVVHLQWSGLLKSYGLHVQYGKHSRLITGYTTDNPPPPVERTAPPSDPAAEEPSGSDAGPAEGAGSGPGGFGGGPGGGPRPDPMESDADGDGKLSREEAPGRMAEFFDNIDSNKDGFLDPAELEARRNSRRGGGEGGGGGPRGPGGRPPADGEPAAPQRPEADASSGETPPSAESSPPTTESSAPAESPASAADSPPTSETKPAENG